MRVNILKIIGLAAALTGCTNGMMGDTSLLTSSQNNVGTGGTDPGTSIGTAYPASVAIAVSPTTTYKTYAAGPGAEVGVIVNLEPKLVEVLTQSTLDTLISKALVDSAAGAIPVVVSIADFKTRLTFPFSMLVKYDGAADKYVLKNLLVATPGKPIVFAHLPRAPVKAPSSFQNLNGDIYLVGGKDKDEYDLNQIVMVSASGNTVRPNTQYPDWGGVANGSYLLYREDDQPLVLPPKYAAVMYNALYAEITHVNSSSVPDPIVALESWQSYISTSGDVNFAVVQFVPGKPRTLTVDNIQEIAFIVVPPGSSGQPERHTWCMPIYDPPTNTMTDAFKLTLQRASGCLANADRVSRLDKAQAAWNQLKTEKGDPIPTTGTKLYTNATAGITVESIP